MLPRTTGCGLSKRAMGIGQTKAVWISFSFSLALVTFVFHKSISNDVLLPSDSSLHHYAPISQALNSFVDENSIRRRADALPRLDTPREADIVLPDNNKKIPPLLQQQTTQQVAKPSNPLPLCYGNRRARYRPLSGEWVANATHISETPYYNLSCPLEFSAYSCALQEKTEQARRAATTRFQPQKCRFATQKDGKSLADVLAGRTLLFFGDSLIQQVLLSLGCLLHARGELHSYHVPWTPCSDPKPCLPELKNCIPCGPHAGSFSGLQIHLKHNVTMVFRRGVEPETDGYIEHLRTLTDRDILVTDAGVHGEPRATMRLLTNRLQEFVQERNFANLPKIVHLVSWSPNFPTPEGAYRRTILTRMLAHKLNMECQPNEEDRYDMERQVLNKPFAVHNETKTRLMDFVSGIVWLTGINSQGKSKVGAGFGRFGDCQHHCLPGPPDDVARALETILLQIMTPNQVVRTSVQ